MPSSALIGCESRRLFNLSTNGDCQNDEASLFETLVERGDFAISGVQTSALRTPNPRDDFPRHTFGATVTLRDNKAGAKSGSCDAWIEKSDNDVTLVPFKRQGIFAS